MANLIFNHWTTYVYLFWLLVVIIVNIWLGFANSRRPKSVQQASPTGRNCDGPQDLQKRHAVGRSRRQEPVREKVNV